MWRVDDENDYEDITMEFHEGGEFYIEVAKFETTSRNLEDFTKMEIVDKGWGTYNIIGDTMTISIDGYSNGPYKFVFDDSSSDRTRITLTDPTGSQIKLYGTKRK